MSHATFANPNTHRANKYWKTETPRKKLCASHRIREQFFLCGLRCEDADAGSWSLTLHWAIWPSGLNALSASESMKFQIGRTRRSDTGHLPVSLHTLSSSSVKGKTLRGHIFYDGNGSWKFSFFPSSI